MKLPTFTLLLGVFIIGFLYYVQNMMLIKPAASELQVFRTDAKVIQAALNSYYCEWNSFPDENKINEVLINKCGRIPRFRGTHTKIIKKYKKVNKNNYVITFNPYNKGNLQIKNCKLTANTDINHLK